AGEPEDFVALRFVYREARHRCLVQHPFERDLCETALGFGITAADIAMYAGEPHLLQIFWTLLSRLGIGRQSPQMVAEERAALVDGDGMAANLDCRIVRDIGNLQRVLDPAHGADRIPHTHEPRPTFGAGHRG